VELLPFTHHTHPGPQERSSWLWWDLRLTMETGIYPRYRRNRSCPRVPRLPRVKTWF